MSSENIAKLLAEFASDKKAEDIIILDMKEVVNFCDYFVICSGTSTRQVKAIAEGMIDGLEEQGMTVRFKQGLREGQWALVDLGDVVGHVFTSESRDFYGLDYLWQEAPQVQWDQGQA